MPKFLGMSRQLREVAETKISAGPSRVMGPAELIEMVQYITGVDKTRHIHTQAQRHKVTMCRWCPIKLNAGAYHRGNFETPKHLPVRTLDSVRLALG